MKQISDLVAAFLENDIFLFVLAISTFSFLVSTLARFLGDFGFSFWDFIRDSFRELKTFLSKVYERFKAWFFKYQTDDQDIAE